MTSRCLRSRLNTLSEVVFQGTIEGFRGSGADRTVMFRVSRVWKGRVGPTFEMPAIETSGGLCTAFWSGLLAVGNELVVYASRGFIPDFKEYLPWRSKTTLVSRTHHPRDRLDQKLPLRLLRHQLLSTRRGEPVILRSPV
jgi:hypothetical protein